MLILLLIDHLTNLYEYNVLFLTIYLKIIELKLGTYEIRILGQGIARFTVITICIFAGRYANIKFFK